MIVSVLVLLLLLMLMALVSGRKLALASMASATAWVLVSEQVLVPVASVMVSVPPAMARALASVVSG